MAAAREKKVQRRANLIRRMHALGQHQAARDPETGKSQIAEKGGRIGGPRRAEQFGDARIWSLASNLKRWHGVPMEEVREEPE
jgi:hypothetical protein